MNHIKMLLYGEPGVGKSVFASKSPRPFFITTDGNFEWLEDFGAKSEDHIQVYSWEEAKKVFADDKKFEKYDTIVIDLIEDLFKWAEQEFCIKNRIDHISDIGYGKGYDITRNEFFLEISKLLGKPKNVILISHGETFVVKDRRGVEHTKYAPSKRLPDKVLDMIEGRLRYCLRCYCKAEETKDGKLVKNRYLSLIPKENEFGIIRGVDENRLPQDINLDWNEFAKYIEYENEKVGHIVAKKENSITPISDDSMKIPETKQEKVINNPMRPESKKEEIEEEPVQNPELTPIILPEEEEPEKISINQEPDEEPSILPNGNVEKPVVEETKKEESKPLTNEEKLAAIRAKLLSIKNKEN